MLKTFNNLRLLLCVTLLTNIIQIIQGATCDDQHWKCNSGQCIQFHERCDGVANCIDASDETSVICIGLVCPPYAFRCAYGACVGGNAECNGEKDCYDNSDELTSKCVSNSMTVGVGDTDNTSNNCPPNQFRCKTNDCIKSSLVCDGAADCLDGTDETVDVCASFACPEYGFRCGYGGCVYGKAKCNGVRDCFDNSDESPMLCYGSTDTLMLSRPPPSPPQTSAPTLATKAPARNRCQLNVPINSNVFYSSSDSSSRLRNGTYVLNYESIRIKCQQNYIIRGQENNVCLDGQWINEMPYCQRYCSSSALYDTSLNVSCEYLGYLTSCQEPLLPTTIAKLTCAFGYRRISSRDYVVCINGDWDLPVVKCEPICGEQVPQGVAYIVGGRAVENNTLVPWHVGIYSDVIDPGKFRQICGGTIVTTKLIVSAAHCFWDLSASQLHDSSHYMIATGKYYLDYNHPDEALLVQKIPVLKIEYPLGYQDFSGLYSADIAVLILSQHIVLRAYVVPICIEYSVSFADKYIIGGLTGMVAGWGLTQSGGNSSEILKVIDLPTIDFATCKRELPASARRFVTNDKFCAGYRDQGESVCVGDSGGGLVIPVETDGRMVYYLRGIVSTGANKQLSCDENVYTTFTNVNFYADFIRNVDARSRS